MVRDFKISLTKYRNIHISELVLGINIRSYVLITILYTAVLKLFWVSYWFIGVDVRYLG